MSAEMKHTPCPPVLRLSLRVRKQVGRTDRRDSAIASILVWGASLSLKAWYPPQPRDPRVGTAGNKDTAPSGLVRSSLPAKAWATSPNPGDTGAGGWSWQEGSVKQGAHSGNPLCLCGLKLAFSTQRHWEAKGQLWAITAFPHQENLGCLAQGNSFCLSGGTLRDQRESSGNR